MFILPVFAVLFFYYFVRQQKVDLVKQAGEKINTFHQQCSIYRIRWHNNKVLRRTFLTPALLTWLCSEDECIRKVLLYSELVVNKRIVGQPRLVITMFASMTWRAEMLALMTRKSLLMSATNTALLSARDCRKGKYNLVIE